MMGTLEVIVQEASKVRIILPNVNALKEALKKGKEWSERVDKIQVSGAKCEKFKEYIQGLGLNKRKQWKFR